MIMGWLLDRKNWKREKEERENRWKDEQISWKREDERKRAREDTEAMVRRAMGASIRLHVEKMQVLMSRDCAVQLANAFLLRTSDEVKTSARASGAVAHDSDSTIDLLCMGFAYYGAMAKEWEELGGDIAGSHLWETLDVSREAVAKSFRIWLRNLCSNMCDWIDCALLQDSRDGARSVAFSERLLNAIKAAGADTTNQDFHAPLVRVEAAVQHARTRMESGTP